MMAVIGTMLISGVFVGAMMTALGVIWATVAPQWRRIALLASGRIEQPFSPLEQLAMAERRIAVRRWATAPAVAATRRLRAA